MVSQPFGVPSPGKVGAGALCGFPGVAGSAATGAGTNVPTKGICGKPVASVSMDPQRGGLIIIVSETGPGLCDPECPCRSMPLLWPDSSKMG